MGQRLDDGNGCCLDLEAWALPVTLDGRAFRGDLDIRIDAQGKWHYNGSPIEHKAMVCLFASMLMLDGRGHHWLVTPTELGRIQVEDAPFIAVDMRVCGKGRDQIIRFCTNVDELVSVGPATPLALMVSPATGDLAPYVCGEKDLKVKISRAVYYHLMERGVVENHNGQDVFGVWSSGEFFPLGQFPSGPDA